MVDRLIAAEKRGAVVVCVLLAVLFTIDNKGPSMTTIVADMLLYSWDGGLDVCVDLTGSSPLTQTVMVDFVPGLAVIDAAQRKRGKYMDRCATIGYVFLLFSFSSLGELETDAITLLKRIQNCGPVWRRLVSKVSSVMIGHSLNGYLDDLKFGVCASGGSEDILHAVNRLIEDRGDNVGLSILGRPEKQLAGVFPPNIVRPLYGVKLLAASVDFDFSSDLVIKRVNRTIVLMDTVSMVNDPRCELLLIHAGISKLYFAMRTCSLRVFEMAQYSFDAALRSALERIVTTSGPGFGDWQWRLSSLPFGFGGLRVYYAGDVLNYTFLASRLESASLQTKLLRHSSIVISGPTYDDALSRISVGKEVDIGLGGGRDKPLRPVDMLLYSWDRRLDVCVDLIGSSPLTQTGMVDFVNLTRYSRLLARISRSCS
ncbi:hypothetical protein Tco_1371173 [Tanacetum coccineum]